MTQSIQIGKINKLLIDRITPPGIFLRDLDGKDVLLPNRYVTPQMQIFDTLDVFIYTDSEDRIVATTETPKAYADEFGVFEVVGISGNCDKYNKLRSIRRYRSAKRYTGSKQ